MSDEREERTPARVRALLVVDMQEDFMDGGALAVAGARDLVPVINGLTQKVGRTAAGGYDLVVASKDWHPKSHCSFEQWPDHCVAGTPGADFAQGLDHSRFARVVVKGTQDDTDSYSAFWDGPGAPTPLAPFLEAQGVTDVDVCGVALDYCVQATALDAHRLGYRTRVLTFCHPGGLRPHRRGGAGGPARGRGGPAGRLRSGPPRDGSHRALKGAQPGANAPESKRHRHMPYYIRRGEDIIVSDHADTDIQRSLPLGSYVLGAGPLGFYLTDIAPFALPPRIYGGMEKTAERILSTFNARKESTGVVLSGEKGSGKTLTAKILSRICAAQGIATIVVNAPFRGDQFSLFLQQIEQRVLILFDEFEKVYGGGHDGDGKNRYDRQDGLLTLMDGVYPQQKLFCLTCNDADRVTWNMRNRPGRVFYHLEYGSVEPEFVREYCEEHLKNRAYLDAMERLSGLYYRFNFDMLAAIVEEMNRYNEGPAEVLRYLNAKPDANGMHEHFAVHILVDGEELDRDQIYPEDWVGNALEFNGVITHTAPVPGEKEAKERRFRYAPKHLVRFDGRKGEYRFEHGDSVLLLRKIARKDPYRSSHLFREFFGDPDAALEERAALEAARETRDERLDREDPFGAPRAAMVPNGEIGAASA
jgi:nicotinamidase-related amidase